MTCRCGHNTATHEHYHQFTYCAVPGCPCLRFRRKRWWWPADRRPR